MCLYGVYLDTLARVGRPPLRGPFSVTFLSSTHKCVGSRRIAALLPVMLVLLQPCFQRLFARVQILIHIFNKRGVARVRLALRILFSFQLLLTSVCTHTFEFRILMDLGVGLHFVKFCLTFLEGELASFRLALLGARTVASVVVIVVVSRLAASSVSPPSAFWRPRVGATSSSIASSARTRPGPGSRPRTSAAAAAVGATARLSASTLSPRTLSPRTHSP